METLAQRQEAEITRLNEAARSAGFVVVRTAGGFTIAPAPDGQPLTHEQFHALPEAVRQRLEEQGHALEERMEATLRQLRQNEREAQAAHAKLVREVAAAGTRQLVREVKETFESLAPGSLRPTATIPRAASAMRTASGVVEMGHATRRSS